MSEEMKDFENVLGAYRPETPRVNRDSLMFEAGRARGLLEGKSALWRWRVAAGFLVCATGLLALLGPEWGRSGREMAQNGNVLGSKSTENRTESAAAVGGSVQQMMPFVRAGGESSYLEVRDRVLLLGMNGLPSTGAEGESSPGTGAVKRSSDIPDAAPEWQQRAAGLSGGEHS